MSSFVNRLNLAFNYALNRSWKNLYPKMMGIEITNHCNLECVMCPHSKMTRPKGIMDFETFKGIIDQIKGKVELVYLFGIGESLLVKNFFEYVSYAKQNGLATCLSTNATVINASIAERLVASGIDFLIMAVDGSEPETYNQIRVGGDFHKTLEKCKLVLNEKIRQKAKIDITVQIILMEKNRGDERRQQGHFTRDERKAINHFRIKPHFDTFAQIKRDVEHVHACYFLWDLMFVTWDAKVSLCCFDYDQNHAIGDLAGSTVPEIWNGPKIAKVRNLHRQRRFENLELCKTCTLPELGYFSAPAVLASTIFNAFWQRKLLAYFEKLYVLGETARLNKRLSGRAETTQADRAAIE